MIDVLIVEDQTLLRDAVSALLSLEPDISVVGAVGTGADALDAAARLRPDVALLDIELPDLDGLSVAEALATSLPSCRVVIVTTFGRPGYLRRAMAANVAGFVLKEAPAAELASVVRRAHAGEQIVDAALALSTLREGDDPLTPRERDVLRAARVHSTVAELAEHLYLSEGTVRNYLSSVMHKLGARNRAEAIATAEQKGWL
ncbi:MAG TPA: response regulator transcription factor [Acidimicrobiales bacterium]|jgi:two-component system response regulator DesR|nr:response regulator transcription factor [Acidimicrobiales bacterium]